MSEITQTEPTPKGGKFAPCPKCGGKGEIKAYKHVAGGTCFRCGGSGRIAQKAGSKPSQKFRMSAISRETGERVMTNTISARSKEEALRKYRTQLSGSPGYHPDTAQVVEDAGWKASEHPRGGAAARK